MDGAGGERERETRGCDGAARRKGPQGGADGSAAARAAARAHARGGGEGSDDRVAAIATIARSLGRASSEVTVASNAASLTRAALLSVLSRSARPLKRSLAPCHARSSERLSGRDLFCLPNKTNRDELFHARLSVPPSIPSATSRARGVGSVVVRCSTLI